MTDTFRALCAELIRVNDDVEAGGGGWCRAWDDVTDRARAALTEQPVGPTDEELVKHYDRAVTSAITIRVAVRKLTMDDRDAATVVGLRAVLARWGQS